jgi:hypothetical protein
MSNGFGPNHYTRDWDLLAGACREWTEIRRRIGLGSKATQAQIEAVWREIFAGPTSWPFIRRVFHEMMRDRILACELRRYYWHELQPWELRGFTFEEILAVVLQRLGWVVVRNACTWLNDRGETDVHWARFWNTENLCGELRRAINQEWEREGPRDEPLPDNL